MAITTGMVPASATAGMLLGFGIRLGAATRVFSAIGSIALGAHAPDAHARAVLIVTGVLFHVLAMLLCGLVYASLVGESRKHPVAWAIAIGAAAVGVVFFLASMFAGTIALVLTPGNLIAIGVVIALTLPIGMRFALSRL